MYRVEQAAGAHSWVVVDENGRIVSQTQSEQDAIAEACRLAEQQERHHEKHDPAGTSDDDPANEAFAED